MEFQSTRERQAVCQTLMEVTGLPDLWGPDGPTEAAVELVRQNGGPLSPGERVMLLVSFALWEGHKALRFEDLGRLDPRNLRAVGSLLTAIGRDAGLPPEVARSHVGRWIADHRSLSGAE